MLEGRDKKGIFMAVKVIDHGDHTHTIKIIDTVVEGLVIKDPPSVQDVDKQAFTESFGWSDEKFRDLSEAFLKFSRYQEAGRDLYPGLPEGTFTSNLADFLASRAFRDLGITFKTNNDYFILGAMAMAVLASTRIPDLDLMEKGKGIEEVKKLLGKGPKIIGPIQGNSEDLKDLLELLSKMSKKKK